MQALRKYARIGAVLGGAACKEEDVTGCCDLLVGRIDEWTEALRMPRLSQYGARSSDLDRIVRDAGNKNNPVRLADAEIRALLLMRL